MPSLTSTHKTVNTSPLKKIGNLIPDAMD